VIVTVEVPVRPGTVEIVAVGVPPVPPKATLLFGTSLVSDELATLVLRSLGLLSTSESLRVIRPMVSPRHALGLPLPATTEIVGASLTGVTLTLTVATFEFAVPSSPDCLCLLA